MKYVLYAYRPAIGVAICKRGDQWLMVEAFYREGDAELISEKESILIANRLGLENTARSFDHFEELRAFLVSEYNSAWNESHPAAFEQEDSIEALLDFMNQATVLELIDEARSENLIAENPLRALQMLEAIEGHSKFMADPLVLSKLNPLKQECKRNLGRDNLAGRKTLAEVIELDGNRDDYSVDDPNDYSEEFFKTANMFGEEQFAIYAECNPEPIAA